MTAPHVSSAHARAHFFGHAGDRAFDAGVAGFALWTLCSHATVALGGSSNDLLWAAAAVGGAALLAAAARAWRRRGGAARADAERTRAAERVEAVAASAPLWPRVVVGMGAAACAAAWLSGAPLALVWGLAAGAVALACAREFGASGAEGAAADGVPASATSSWALLALAGVCIVVASTAHRPDADDSFYLNLAVASADAPDAPLLATDSLHRVPGAPLALPVYRIHSLEPAVGALARLSGRPVLDVAHLFLPALLAAFLPFVYARMMRRLVPRAWLVATALAVCALLFTAVASHGWANFGLVRLHQGKGLLATLLLPAVVVYALEFAKDGGLRAWLRLAAVQVAAIGVSASALWLAPLVAGPALLAGSPSLRGRSWRRIALGCSASGYVLAVALGVRAETVAAFRDAPIPSPEMTLSSLRLANQAARAVLSSGVSGAFLLFVAFGAWAFARGDAARRLCAFSAAATLVLWNPFVADWIAANGTSAATYWRVLWLLPMPALLAIVLTAPMAWRDDPGARAAVLACALVIFGGSVALTPRAFAISPANLVRLGVPGWKVPESEFEAARWIVESAAEHETVLAPRLVAPWLTTFRRHPIPLVVRAEYLPVLYEALGPEELRRRMMLMRLVSGGRQDPGAMSALQGALAGDELEVVGLARAAIAGSQLPRLLRETGFQKIHENADYEIWRRARSDAPGGSP